MPENTAALNADGDNPQPGQWTAVRAVPSAPALREAVSNALFQAGSQGVQEDGDTFVTHYPPATDMDTVVRLVREADSAADVQLAPVEDIDWSEAWKLQLHPQQVGELTIVPTWLANGRDLGRTIVIEPGMAFGTGDHATTRGVVRLLPAVLKNGDTVADLGAGSAVLSIAAALLGAARVFAIELDSDAIPDARLNVETNCVADRVHVLEGDAAVILPLVAPVNVVLANIVSSVLLELLPLVRHALADGGKAILSGILIEERQQMLDALAGSGWEVLNEDSEDIWWSVAVAPA